MSALWSRGEARDYIDIDTVTSSGRFSRDDVLAIADQFEAEPLDRRTLAMRFREASRHDEAIFAQYGVDAARRASILASFTEWAVEIDPPSTGPGDTIPAPCRRHSGRPFGRHLVWTRTGFRFPADPGILSVDSASIPDRRPKLVTSPAQPNAWPARPQLPGRDRRSRVEH